MIKNTISNIITKPSVLGPAVFVGVGLARTVYDYRKEEHDRKTRVLLKDTAILAGSVAGFAIVSPLTRLLCKTKFADMFFKSINKLVSKSAQKRFLHHHKTALKTRILMKNTEHVVKESIAGTINTFAGIVGAIYSNELMHKYVFSKPPFFDEKAHQKELQKEKLQPQTKGYFSDSRVFKNFDYVDPDMAKRTASRVFSTISDMPNMKLLEKPMIALTGFSVANTKGYHNKLKKTTYELLANTLIPTIFVSAMTLIVQHKKSWIKYPSLFAALSLGAGIGAKVANRYNEKINQTIDGIDMKYMVV